MLGKIFDGIRSIIGGNQNLNPDLKEQRKLVRLRCHYDVKFEMGEKKYGAVILDMGMKGLKIRCSEKLKVGDVLRISTPTPITDAPSEPVDCTVVWMRRPENNFLTFAGLRYSSSADVMKRSWIKYFLKVLGFKTEIFFSKRQRVRIDCYVDGKVQSDVSKPFRPMKVCNLSVGGALIEFYDEIALGTDLTLEIGPGKDLQPFTAKARAIKVAKVGNLFQYGVEFTNVSAHEMRNLTAFLKKSLQAVWSESAR
jgi:c-di-GMP-binding flagellar brake protein YcgR